MKRYSVILATLFCFSHFALAGNSVSNDSISKIFACFNRLKSANLENFPGNSLLHGDEVLAFPQDVSGKNLSKVIFISNTTVSCAEVPTDQGTQPGKTLLRINPKDFGVDSQPYLMTFGFHPPTEGDKNMLAKYGEPLPSGNGGPYSASVVPNHPSQFKIVDVKPISCLPRRDAGESLYKYLESTIQKQNSQFRYEAKYLSTEEDANKTRAKMEAALQSCKSMSETLDAVIRTELLKFQIEPTYGHPSKSDH